MSPIPDLVDIPDVTLLLRGWQEDKRRLRVIARLGLTDLSAFCSVANVNEDSFALMIGDSDRNMVRFPLEGWRFAFTDAPPADNEILGEEIESAILGIRVDFKLTLFIFLLV